MSIELSSLCGMHRLGGVEMGDECVKFVLDGIKYKAIEDPDDGWRSYLGELVVTDENVAYTFDSVDVLCSMSEEFRDDILEFKDIKNGQTILRIGTGDFGDWYPYCVFDWMPEKMACNEEKG